MLATQSPRMLLATETGERCFTSSIDQIGLMGILYFTVYLEGKKASEIEVHVYKRQGLGSDTRSSC